MNGIKIKETALAFREKLGFNNTNNGELAAFIAYGMSLPDNFLCLVDTYNVTASGVPNYICVAFALQKAEFSPKGIRLDSGDLAE